jgi:hypothetical protein
MRPKMILPILTPDTIIGALVGGFLYSGIFGGVGGRTI